jgi:hypothetical protein
VSVEARGEATLHPKSEACTISVDNVISTETSFIGNSLEVNFITFKICLKMVKKIIMNIKKKAMLVI